MDLKLEVRLGVGLVIILVISLAPLHSDATCGPDQFFRPSDSTCRNCSELNHIFFGHQADWLSREVMSDLTDSRRLGDQDKIMSHSDKLLISDDIETRAPPETRQHESRLKQKQRSKDGPSEELLSRLINSVEPQDQEFTESSSPSTTSTSSQDQMGDTGSNDLHSDDDDTVQSASGKTQNLIERFVRSSSLVGNELLNAIDQCRRNQNASACQMWSNLCVLTMYSHSDTTTNQRKGSYLRPSSTSVRLQEGGEWKRRQTWQQCRQVPTSESICNSWRDWFRFERKSSLDVANIFAQAEEQLVTKLGSAGPLLRLNQAIKLLAYKYSLDGRFIGADQFGLSEMAKFCPLVPSDRGTSVRDSVRLGNNMRLRCKFDSSRATGLMQPLNETIFIDLYLAYPLNGVMLVKPVPVLINNMLYNGWLINRQHSGDPTRWKLVHRFFFHSLIKLGDDLDLDADEMLVYAESVVLDFRFKRQDKGALMSQLLLTIDYGQEIRVAAKRQLMINNATDSHQLQTGAEGRQMISDIIVKQTLVDMLSYQKDLDLAITILAILSSVWSLIKCYNVQKCYGLVKLDLNSLFKFTLIACDTIGTLLALLTLAFMSFLFVALKFYTQLQILAPSEELDSALVLNLQLALMLKSIGVLHKLYALLNVDIFFIDWERPKMLTTSEMVDHHATYTYATNQSKQQRPEGSGSTKSSVDPRFPFASAQQVSSASFWRPYTIINKWLQMQTLRRQNLTLQLMLFVFLVDYCRITQLASEDTDFSLMPNKLELGSDKSFPELTPTMSRSFRVVALACVYSLLALCQVLFKKYLYEPLIKNSVHEFVDLCSVANVSLFSMLYPRFGYYIHGRNANGTGDCGIAEMNALLEREERDLCTKRGLAPNSDQQTFVLVLPKIINDHYRKILFGNDLHAPNTIGKLFGGEQLSDKGLNSLRSALNLSFASRSSASSSFSSNRARIETTVAKNKTVNLFLTNFLEHIYKDIDYSIRERRRFESLLWDVDFDEESFAIATTSGARNIGAPLTAASMGQYGDKATFCVDRYDSFTSLLLFGLEGDLILVELLSLLTLDLWMKEPSLVITATLIWLLHNTFKALYVSCARHNLVAKSAVDEKFLFR